MWWMVGIALLLATSLFGIFVYVSYQILQSDVVKQEELLKKKLKKEKELRLFDIEPETHKCPVCDGNLGGVMRTIRKPVYSTYDEKIVFCEKGCFSKKTLNDIPDNFHFQLFQYRLIISKAHAQYYYAYDKPVFDSFANEIERFKELNKKIDEYRNNKSYVAEWLEGKVINVN